MSDLEELKKWLIERRDKAKGLVCSSEKKIDQFGRAIEEAAYTAVILKIERMEKERLLQ